MSRAELKRLRFTYWTSTLLFVTGEAWLGLQYLAEVPRMTDALETLGYPIYFMKMLGLAKLLGIVALLAGVSTVLKEWAYAGFTFEACGAFASHLSADDSLGRAVLPLAFLCVQMISYVCWKQLKQHQALRRRRHAFALRRRAVESHA